MEFKIRVSRSGCVWLDKIDPMTNKVITDFSLWDSRHRVFSSDESAHRSGLTWARNFAEFTGFELVEE
jgi:hypothetical protein